MSEIVEHVAAALRPGVFNSDPIKAHQAASPSTVESERERARVSARLAITALRVFVPVVRDVDGLPAHQLVGAPADIWRALIDAALAEDPAR